MAGPEGAADPFEIDQRGAEHRALAPEAVRPLERARDFLVDKGYQEAITYSFVSPQLQKRIRGRQAAVKLKNPISVHLAEMRVSLLPGLLEALANNARRQVRDVRLFETGHVFLKKDGQIREDQWLGGVVMGSTLAASWDQRAREVDFFDDLLPVTEHDRMGHGSIRYPLFICIRRQMQYPDLQNVALSRKLERLEVSGFAVIPDMTTSS